MFKDQSLTEGRIMWQKIRSIVSATNSLIKRLARYTKNSIAALPQSLRKIKDDENVSFAFKNLLSVNIINFLVPWTALTYGKRFLFDLISYEFGIPKPVATVAETLVDYTIM